jgi:hypothetical protein
MGMGNGTGAGGQDMGQGDGTGPGQANPKREMTHIRHPCNPLYILRILLVPIRIIAPKTIIDELKHIMRRNDSFIRSEG